MNSGEQYDHLGARSPICFKGWKKTPQDSFKNKSSFVFFLLHLFGTKTWITLRKGNFHA